MLELRTCEGFRGYGWNMVNTLLEQKSSQIPSIELAKHKYLDQKGEHFLWLKIHIDNFIDQMKKVKGSQMGIIQTEL